MADTEANDSANDLQAGPARRSDFGQPRPYRYQPLMPRVMAKVDLDENGCWSWQGGKQSDGYGIISWEGRGWLTHRAVYSHEVGPIPEDMQVDHLCMNRGCVNPAHLDLVTTQENTRRSANSTGSRNAAKTHCPKGHEYTLDNTLMLASSRHPGKFGRLCGTCYPERRNSLQTQRQHEAERAA